MTELIDLQMEKNVVAILVEESRVLGAEHARQSLERTRLEPEDFTAQEYRATFVDFANAARAGNVLVHQDQLRHLDSSEVLSPVLLDSAAGRLRDLAVRRQIWLAARRILDASRDEAIPVSQLISRFDSEARGINARSSSWKHHTEAVDRAVSRIRSVQEGKAAGVMKTGYEALDSVIGGLPPTLCVVAGLPGMSKSAFVGSVLRNMARRGDASAVFSLEDRHDWLAFRWIAHESDIAQVVLRNCKLNGEHWTQVGAADAAIRGWKAPVWIDDRPMLRPSEILVSAREALRDKGVRAIWLDNMTAVRFTRGPRMDLEIQDFLLEARALADEFQAPFVVVSHTRRRDGLKAGELPTLTDCSESAAFEKLSRMAIGVALNHEIRSFQIGVLKNTNGGGVGATISLPFRAKSALLEDGPE